MQDTPLSITAVDTELLKSRNQTDLAQITAQAPNVTLNAMGGAYGSSIGASIRGIGQFDFNPAYEPGVGMYIDHVYYATLTGGVFDLLDLDRVEVLRGPQGTLTGRNSIGGAIKLFSKKPGDKNEGSVEPTYGSRQRIDIRASANFVLGDGLFARISGVHKQQDGYVKQLDYGCRAPGNAQGIQARPNVRKDCVVSDLGERNYSGVRGALRYNPGDNLDFIVSADYTRENRANAAAVVTFIRPDMAQYTCGRFCTYANFYAPAGGKALVGYEMPNTTKFNGWGVSANLTAGLSDSLNFQSITAYRKYRQVWGTDDDFTPDLVEIGQGFNDLSFWFFSQEVRLNDKVGDNVDFTVGAFYSDQRSVYFTRQDIRYIFGPALPFQFTGDDPVNADSKAVYGTVIFRPAENLTLTGGLRYTDEHKDYTFARRDYDGARHSFPIPLFNLAPLDGFKAVYDGNKLDWRASADYRFSPALLAYVTIGTGFKGGGVTARPFDVNQARNGSFGPDTVTAYEVGVKTDFLDRRFRLNLSAFYNDYKDIQLPLIDCSGLGSSGPCGVRQNAGDGNIKGFELEMAATPAPGLSIDGSLSHLTGKWKRIAPQVGTSIQRTDPIVSPKWKWSLGIQNRADFGDGGSLTPRFDVSYTGKTNAGRSVTPNLDFFQA